jgi:hypothetical protein
MNHDDGVHSFDAFPFFPTCPLYLNLGLSELLLQITWLIHMQRQLSQIDHQLYCPALTPLPHLPRRDREI